MRGLPGWRRECCLKLRARSTSSVTLTGICFEPTSHGILVSTMQDPQQLISRAYQQARRSGKPDWHRMTAAVLKNRLLEITSREFNEARYDASNFMEFVSRYPELLSVDDSEFPPVVTLRGSEADRLLSTDAGPIDLLSHQIRPLAGCTGLLKRDEIRMGPKLAKADLYEDLKLDQPLTPSMPTSSVDGGVNSRNGPSRLT